MHKLIRTLNIFLFLAVFLLITSIFGTIYINKYILESKVLEENYYEYSCEDSISDDCYFLDTLFTSGQKDTVDEIQTISVKTDDSTHKALTTDNFWLNEETFQYNQETSENYCYKISKIYDTEYSQEKYPIEPCDGDSEYTTIYDKDRAF